jgi:quinoprotein glucose dehydrogenase
MRKLIVFLAVIMTAAASQSSRTPQPWPAYAADSAATHYSPLADITPAKVAQHDVAWEWKPSDKPLQEFGTQPGTFQNPPLMIDNVLYVSTMYNRAVALDAETGKEIWSYDPKAYEDGQPPNGT